MFGVLRMAPWWRGPVLLLRRAGVAFALAAAALVATLPAGAAVPFLSASRSATLHHQIAAACPTSVGLNVAVPLPFGPGIDADGDLVPPTRADFEQQRADAATYLSPLTGLGGAVEAVAAALSARGGSRVTEDIPILLMTRTGFQDNVTVLDGPQGPGVWVPDRYAKLLNLKIGDTLQAQTRRYDYSFLAPQPSTTIRVAAIYRDLRGESTRQWWCGIHDLYDPPGADFSNTFVPPLVLMDQDAALGVYTSLFADTTHLLQYPLADPAVGVDRARTLAAGLNRTVAGLRTGVQTTDDAKYGSLSGAHASSQLPAIVRRADLARSGMLPAVVPITAIGALVGLLVVAAAAVFWVQRRRRELTILSSHGVSARALGLKAVLESAPALLVGAVAGWALAWVLVAWAGPDPVLSREARPQSLLGAVAALVASVVVVGLVAALTCRSLTDTVRARHRTILGALPWELLLLAGAYPLWQRLGDSRSTADVAGGVGSVAHVPSRLLVVPILVVAGLTALVARITARWLRRRSLRRSPRAISAFLGWRRLGRQAVMTVLLASAVAIPIALAAYGAAVTGSVRTTIEGEAKLRVGADVVIALTDPAPIPAAWAGHATEVMRLNSTQIGGFHTDVLAVDVDEFPKAAFWTGALGDGSLAHLLAPLRSAAPGETVLIASRPVPDGFEASTYAGRPVFGGKVEVTTVPVLPASQGGYPVAIVAKDALGDQARYAHPQIWVRGDPDTIRRQAVAAGLPIQRLTVADALYANTLWEPLTYTFTYLTALSLLTGVVTIVGLLLYLEAQAPLHRRSYVLLRRMGLRPRSHRRALLGEIGYPMLAGLLLGISVAAGLTWFLRADIEMNPGTPPDTIIAWPTTPVGLIALAVLLAAVAAAGYAQRRISRARPSEVLRDTVG